MSLDKLAIIFLIIVVPISFVLGLYTRTQTETLNTQLAYDVKLNNATYDAVKAYQMNAFNEDYSNLGNVRINNINASVSTFFTSLASSLNMSGYNREFLNTYVPAVVFTMYDGFYVYSKYENTLDDKEFVTQSEADTINNAKRASGETDFVNASTYQNGDTLNGLKPFIFYSCRYKMGSQSDFTISYSLDNYIVVQGIVGGKAVNKSGYVINLGDIKFVDGDKDKSDNQKILYYKNHKIAKESLMKDYVMYEGLSEPTLFSYHKRDGVKYYADEKNLDGSYVVDKDGIELFERDGSHKRVWFTVSNGKRNDTEYSFDFAEDYSAFNYYYDAYEFTKWLNDCNIGSNLMVKDAVDVDLKQSDPNALVFNGIGSDTDGTNSKNSIEAPESNFNEHRRAVIRYAIEYNLSIIINNYNQFKGSDGNYVSADFQMPEFNETEWDKIQDNMTVISYLQGLPIGTKLYNGVSVIPNTTNDEVITERSIAIVPYNNGNISTSDSYYYFKMDQKDLTEKFYNNAGVKAPAGVLDYDLKEKFYPKDDGTREPYYNKIYFNQYDANFVNYDAEETKDSEFEFAFNNNLLKYIDEKYKSVNSGGTEPENEAIITAYYSALGRERAQQYRQNTNYSEITELQNVEGRSHDVVPPLSGLTLGRETYRPGTDINDTFIKNGYHFMGYVDQNGTEIVDKNGKYNPGSIIDEDTIINEKDWEPIVYTITCHYKGETYSGTYTVESEDVALKKICGSTDEQGFLGWSGTGIKSGCEKNVEIKKGSTGNREYWAHFEDDEYDVIFNKNGDDVEGKMSDMTGLKYKEESTLNPINYQRLGYTFLGWALSPDGEKVFDNKAKLSSANLSGVNMPENKLNLYAVWKANISNITFDNNGGTGGPTETIKAEYEKPMPSVEQYIPTKEGYEFKGWYDQKSAANGTQFYKEDGTSARNWNKFEDATLYASWQEVKNDEERPKWTLRRLDTSMKYASQHTKIRFQLDATDNEKVENVSLDANDIIVKVNNTQVSATKTFESGPTDINDGKNGKRYILALENIQGNGQLSINIPENKIVDSSGNKGTGLGIIFDIYIDNNAPIIKANNEFNGASINFTAIDIAPVGDHAPSGVSGYQITNSETEPTDGWKEITVPGATTVDGKKQTSTTVTLTNSGLKAGTNYIWITDRAGNKASKQITVKYVITLNRGADTSSITVSSNTLPNVAPPGKNGYSFAGYYTEENGGGKQYYNAEGKAIRPCDFTKDTTLYAYWTKGNYTIHFNKNSDEALGTMADQTGEYDNSKPLDKNKFVRYGYVFSNWNTRADGKGTSYQDGAAITPGENNPINLYAQWVKAEATFEEGRYFIGSVKRLSTGDLTATYKTPNNVIKKIKYASIGDDEGQISLEKLYYIKEKAVSYNNIKKNTEYVIISTANSNAPIYIWYDSGIIYWFSEDTSPKLNQQSSLMFKDLNALTEIEQFNPLAPREERLASFDATGITNIRAMFNNCEKLEHLDLSSFDTSNVTDMGSIFLNCKKLKSLDVHNWVTTKISSMDGLFANCEELESLDLSSFNTSNVTDMNSMFSNCLNLTQINVSNFNTSKVTTMYAMFQQCNKLKQLDITNFNTSKVTKMRGMFYGCSELTELDLSSFDTSKVESMYFMFANCYKLERIYASDKFVTTSLNNEQIEGTEGDPGIHTNSTELFKDCNSLKGGSGSDIAHYNIDADYAWIDGRIDPSTSTSRPGYFTNHFFIEFNANNIRAVGEMSVQGIPFNSSKALNTNAFTVPNSTIIKWNTAPDGSGVSFENGQSIRYSLSQIKQIAQDTSDDKNIKLTLYAQWNKASAVFKTGAEVNVIMKKLAGNQIGANEYTKFDHNIKKIARSRTRIPNNTSERIVSIESGTNTAIYMWGDSSTSTIYWYSEDENPALNENSAFMFCGMRNLTTIENLEDIDTSNAKTMESMFESSSSLSSLNIRYFDTSNVTNMKRMFRDMSKLTNLSFNNGFNTSKVTDMSFMFYNCTSLTSIDFTEEFKANSVQNFESMFSNTGLNSLDLSYFDSSSAKSLKNMFYKNSNLSEINFGDNFKAKSVTDFSAMFGACSAITELDLKSFETNSATSMKEMFRQCTNLKTIYARSSFITNSVTNSTDMFKDCTALVGGSGTTYSSSRVDKNRAKIDGLAGEGYFTNHYIISFDKNGGDGTMEEQAIPFNLEKNLDANSFTRNGSYFIEWNSKSDGTGESFENGQLLTYNEENINNIADISGSNKNRPRITLYAQWASNNFINTTTNQAYATLTEAFEDVHNNETIKVLKSSTEPTDIRPTIKENISATLDLNGKTLIVAKSLTNNGTLTITTSQSGGTLSDVNPRYATIKNNEGAQLIINNGRIMNTGNVEGVGENGSAISNYGTTTITGGDISSNSSYSIYNYTNAFCTMSGGNAGTVYNDGEFELTGTGNIIENANSTLMYLVINSRKMIVSGGSINGLSKYGVQQNGDKAILSVTGGSIKGAYGIFADGNSFISINGSSVLIESTRYEAIRALYSDVIIASGNIKGKTDGITVTSTTNKKGSIILRSGSVIGNENGIRVFSNATLTLGSEGIAEPSLSMPEVISNATSGIYYGVYQDSNAKFNFYEGKVVGQPGKSIFLQETDKTYGYTVIKTTRNGRETAILGK